MATHPKKIIDAHCHIGEIPPWKFYDLEHPVKPIVYDYPTPKEFLKKHMDYFKIERALTMSNYGVPIHELSFDLNDVVMEAATTNDRILAAIWVSFLPRNAELTRKALKLAARRASSRSRPRSCSAATRTRTRGTRRRSALADECFDVCEKHDLMFHFHTSPGGNSDINNFIPMVEAYGKRCKIYLVHFGGGVSGHIKLVPKFLQWVRGRLQGLHRHLVGDRLRRALAADGDREARRRRRPRVLRLRRAVVGLRQRVLEDQRRSATSRRSSRTACSGRTTRRPSGRMVTASSSTTAAARRAAVARRARRGRDGRRARRRAAAAPARRTRCSCGCAGCR